MSLPPDDRQASTVRLSAVLGLWLDRPHGEAVDTAIAADSVGFQQLWIGEMATWDAFALATSVGHRTSQISLMLGPFAVSVRDPMMIAMGVASVRELCGRHVDVALGSSSRVVVEEWHGRSWKSGSTRLEESAQIVRSLLDGEKSNFAGDTVSSVGYHLRLPSAQTQIAIAAFGPRAVRTAAMHGDRMVINMVTPKSAAMMSEQLGEATTSAGRTRPRLVAWLRSAVSPTEETLDQLRRGLVTYLGAPGYSQMFADAGFGEVADYARTRPHPGDLLDAIPDDLVQAIGLVGEPDHVVNRMREYIAAGVDEIAVVPATAGDPAGERTLRAIKSLAQQAGIQEGTP